MLPKLSLFEGKDRLKSPEWFGIYEDRRGYVWIGSNLGLLRFNGHRTQTYRLPFATQHVFEVLEDRTGRLWLLCFTNGVCYMDEQGEIRVPSWNKQLQTYLKKSWVRYLHLDAQGTLHLLVEQLDQKPPFLWLSIPTGDTRLQVGDLAQAKLGLAQAAPSDRLFFERLKTLLDVKPYSFQADALGQDQFLSKTGYWLRWHIKGKVVDSLRLEEPAERFFVLDSQTVLVRCPKQSHWLSLATGQMRLQPLAIQPKSGYVAQDRFWLVDRHEELWFYPSFQGLKQVISPAAFAPKMLGLVSNTAQLWGMNPQGFFELTSSSLKPPFRLSHAQWQGDLCYWRNTFFNGFYRWNPARSTWQGLSSLSIHDNIKQIRPITWEGQPALALCSPKGLSLLDTLLRPILDFKTYGFEAWTMAVLDQKEQLWLGTLEGLWRYDKKSKQLQPIPIPRGFLKLEIIDLAQDAQSPYLAVATLNQGLWLYHDQQQTWLPFDPEQAQNPLNHYKVNCILADGPKRFWIGTPNGLNRLEQDPEQQDWRIAYAQEGLDVQQILQTAQALYVLGADSLWHEQSLNPQAFRYSKPLTFAFAGGNDSLVLDDERSLILRFDYIQRFPYPSPRFAYRLSPIGQKPKPWTFTEEEAVVFNELSPGDYHFELSTEASLGQKSPIILTRFIRVSPRYWEQYWFSALILALVAFLSAYLVWWISKLRRKQLERREQFLRLQLQLLNNQMNPHFLFNTLNAIQAYLALGDVWISLDYIAVFARLLRNQLNQSLKTLIPLSEEIQTLRYYLELEKIRLGNNYELSCEAPPDALLQPYAIPPMTLQPLVENAILHGVSPNGKGKISITVQLQGKQLSIAVQDNGIGRKAALEKQQKDQQYGQIEKASLALKNLQQRLMLLQQIQGLVVSLEIQDLEDAQHKALGTLVMLRWQQT